MRFMLRGTEAAESTRATAEQGWALPSFAPAPTPSLPAGGALGVRLQVTRDDATTSFHAHDVVLTLESGVLVSGRRSFGGANKGVEAEARRALGLDSAPAAAAGGPQTEGGKKRGRESGGVGGSGGGGGSRLSAAPAFRRPVIR